MTTPYYKQHWIEIDAARLSVYESLLRYLRLKNEEYCFCLPQFVVSAQKAV